MAGIILIHGPRQSGKTTLAGLIENRLHVNRFSFADAIRESVRLLRPISYRNRQGEWTDEMLKSDVFKKLEVRIPERNFRGQRLLRSELDYVGGGFVYGWLNDRGFRSPGVGDIVINVRDLMRQLGDMAKHYSDNQDFFVDDVLRRHRETGGITLVDDLRFPQEIHKLTRSGIQTYTIKITGRGETTVQHASDEPLPDQLFNLVIDNSQDDPAHQRLLVAARSAVRFASLEGWDE